MEEGEEFDTSDDPRIQPDYEITYKQKVTTEDIFLQMGNKTPSTASCEDMVVKIILPGVQKISEIDVNLFDKFLDCRTSKLYVILLVLFILVSILIFILLIIVVWVYIYHMRSRAKMERPNGIWKILPSLLQCQWKENMILWIFKLAVVYC